MIGLALVVAASLSTASGDAARYDAVMRAQYAAHAAPVPERAEEAQRAYDAYLKSIGQKAKDLSGDAGNSPH